MFVNCVMFNCPLHLQKIQNKDDDEEDPLDAFMAGIETEVKPLTAAKYSMKCM